MQARLRFPHPGPHFPERYFSTLGALHPCVDDTFYRSPVWLIIYREAFGSGGLPTHISEDHRSDTATASIGLSDKFLHPIVEEGNALDTHCRDHTPLLTNAYRLMRLTPISFHFG